MTEKEFLIFAQKVEDDLTAHNPTWAEYPFGTYKGLTEQYYQTYGGVGTIFYYIISTDPVTGDKFRNTALLELSQTVLPTYPDAIPTLPTVTPGATSTVYYGHTAPADPLLNPIWFDTETGDVRIWYSFNGNETWINTGIAGTSTIVHYGHTAPSNPLLSPIWFDTETGDVRIWYSFNGNETWISTGIAGVGKIQFLSDLQDILISNPVIDEHIVFNGTKWVNEKQILSNAFLAQIQTNYSEGAGWSKIVFDTTAGVGYDTETNFNNTLNEYLVPTKGIYTFNINIRVDNLNTGSYIDIDLRKNNITYITKRMSVTNFSFDLSVDADAIVGDTFTVWKNADIDTNHTIITTSWFSGSLKNKLQ